MTNPFKSFVDIKREELPQSLLMFGYFFLVITTFWILKPIKKSLFIAFYDESGIDLGGWHLGAAQAELLAKVLNMVVAYAAATVFASLSNRYQRQQLTTVFGLFFIGCYALYAAVLGAPSDVSIWSFYLFGDLFSTLMVATFFVFLNDIVTPEQAKRTYGLVGLGGVIGGVVGSVVVAGWIEELATSTWLGVCAATTGAIIVLAVVAGRIHDRSHPPSRRSAATDEPTHGEGNAALDGARLVLRSSYLLAIVSIVGIYEMVSTILDFQFSSSIAHYVDGPEIGSAFGRAFALMNGTAFFVQLFLTSFVMKRFGVGIALMILPATTLLGSGAFLVAPVLLVGTLVPSLDGGFAYSVNQSAKESLYVPTTKDEKYKAKAFIDMFVQRFAKALAVGLSLAITAFVTDFSGVRWLSLVTVPLILAWIAAASYAGKHFDAASARYAAEERS